MMLPLWIWKTNMSKFINISKEDEDNILISAFKGMVDKREISKKYKVSTATSERVIKKLKLLHTRKHLINITKRFLAGESVKDLSKEHGITKTAVNQFFKRHGIIARRGKYFCNFDFFEKIDSEEKAYFLGFIYADGCLHKNSLKIAIADRDLDILEKFKKSLNATHPIKVFDYRSKYVNKIQSKFKTALIEITNTKTTQDLINLGVTPKKTETLKFPSITNSLIRHFIRGYFDGDGGICRYTILYKYKNHIGTQTKYNLIICGTPSTLKVIQKYIYEVANVNGYFSKPPKNSVSCVISLCYSGGRSVKKILNYLYFDSNVYLNRKFNKYLEICT